MELKILSWNIWHNGLWNADIADRFDKIATLLVNSNADIIGLQEVEELPPEKSILHYLSQRGYQYLFAPVNKEWGDKTHPDGPALLSKYPIRHGKTYILSDEHNRAAVRADIVINDHLLHVFSTHLTHTHQKDSAVQNTEIQTLIELLPRERTIVMGDFNATPSSTPIGRMQEIFTDTDPTSQPTWSAHPEGCSTCNPEKVDTRLDYIFVSKDLKTISFEVEKSDASDHLPIWTRVEI